MHVNQTEDVRVRVALISYTCATQDLGQVAQGGFCSCWRCCLSFKQGIIMRILLKFMSTNMSGIYYSSFCSLLCRAKGVCKILEGLCEKIHLVCDCC